MTTKKKMWAPAPKVEDLTTKRKSLRPKNRMKSKGMMLPILCCLFNGCAAVAHGNSNNESIYPCKRFTAKGQAIPDKVYWAELRDAYVAAVGGPQASTIEWDHDSTTTVVTGLSPLAVVGHTSAKGRGVFAKAFIPAGTVVWDMPFYAMFITESSFRAFLSMISEEQVCDVLQWCYATNDDEDVDELVVACCLDEGSLVNHEVAGIANVGNPCGDDEDSHLVALRDIEAGEELLEDYGSFEEDLPWFAELMSISWGSFGEWDNYVTTNVSASPSVGGLAKRLIHPNLLLAQENETCQDH